VIKSLSRAITNKFMHEPSRALNDESNNEQMSLSDALKRLYGLDKD
jgi:glutamyl-tRNA reductase